MDEQQKHIVIFSHGFGVRKDDRGLFTDIAAALPGVESVLFDLNDIDETTSQLTVLSLSEQAKRLMKVVERERVKSPNAVIDLICHSQGCRVAALANPSGIRKAVFLAPPTDTGIERIMSRFSGQPGVIIDFEELSKIPRADGSVTLVAAEYWKERAEEDPQMGAYNRLANATELIVVKADQDEVLGETLFDELDSSVKVISMNGDHNFSGDDRSVLLSIVKELLV